MKLNKIFAAFMLMTAVAFTACEPPVPPTPNPGPGPDGQDTTVVTPPTPEGELLIQQAGIFLLVL